MHVGMENVVQDHILQEHEIFNRKPSAWTLELDYHVVMFIMSHDV